MVWVYVYTVHCVTTSVSMQNIVGFRFFLFIFFFSFFSSFISNALENVRKYDINLWYRNCRCRLIWKTFTNCQCFTELNIDINVCVAHNQSVDVSPFKVNKTAITVLYWFACWITPHNNVCILNMNTSDILLGK